MSSDSDSSEVNVEDSLSRTPPKKRKRASTYKKEWEKQFSWLRQARIDECPSTSKAAAFSNAFCCICKKTIDVSHGGLNDIKKTF